MNPHTYSLYARLREPHLLEMLELREGEFILDLGCGAGYFTERIAENGARCCGIDTDRRSLGLARDNVPATFICGSVTDIPIKDNTIEKTLLADVLEHVEEDDRVISELCRIARDKSLLVISVPSREGLLSSTRLHRLFHEEKGSPEYHVRNGYTLDDLKGLLERHNVRVVEVRYAVTLLGEVFLEALKLMLLLVKKDYTSQASLRDADRSFFFKLYRYIIFPFMYKISRLEDLLLSKFVKGHALIIKCIVEKRTGKDINDVSPLRG